MVEGDINQILSNFWFLLIHQLMKLETILIHFLKLVP